MANIQNPNGFEANETIDGVNDIMHIFQPGSAGTRRNKRIILNTLKVFFQIITGGTLNNIVTIGSSEELQDSGVAVADIGANTTASGLNTTHRGSDGTDHFNLLNSLKGMNHVVLTNYTTTGVPAIAANSQVEINGSIYTNPSEVAISGSTSNDTWYDILLTPSGTTFTASFVARGTGVWSDSKQGLYSGNNRVVAIAKRDTSSSIWINKNILIVNNRIVKIKSKIGDWNMSIDDTITIGNGISDFLKVRSLTAIIIRDDDNRIYNLASSETSGDANGSIPYIDATIISLTRRIGSLFDGPNFDSTSFNRGWVIITYEV